MSSNYRPGFPSANELTRIRHRLACGENFQQVAEIYQRNPKTLQRFLGAAHTAPEAPGRTFSITTKGGAVIENLSLQDLQRLAPCL